MTESSDGLTLEGLAQILRGHMDGTAARFAEVANQFAEERAERKAQDARWRAGLDDLRGQVVTVVGLVHAMSQNAARQAEELVEHRQQIREIFSRMEQHDARMEQFAARMVQHDARFEAVNLEIREMRRDIRRILDAMERRGGDGGRREA